MAESGSLARAREVTADNETASALFNPLFDVAETLPVGGAARQMADEADFNRRAVAYRNLQAYTNLLRTAADNDPLSAYLWIAFNCAYSPPGEQRLGERLEAVPTWRATALLSFKAATCIGYGGAAVDRLLEADPRFVEINYFLAARDMVRGRADEAIERWRTAFSWRPRWPSVTNALAQALLSLEEFGESIEFFDRTLELSPSSAEALLGKVRALTYQGRYEAAIETVDRLLALQRWFTGDARFWRAFNEAQLGKNDAAWEDIELAAKLLANAAVPKLAGIIAYRRGDVAVSRAKFEESREREPQDCETGFYLGTVLSEQRIWSRAADVLVDTAACLDRAEARLTAELDKIRSSNDRPERKARQVARREQEIASGRRMRATSWFNTAVSFYNLARRDLARRYAAKVEGDEQFGERARDLLRRLDQ